MKTFIVQYKTNDGWEFWGEIAAESANEARAKAFEQEPVCIQGFPMIYRVALVIE